MAGSTTTLDSFAFFPELALELKDNIFNKALSDEIQPALFHYKKGCWRPRFLSEDGEDYDHSYPESNLYLLFYHDLLDAVQLDVPLFFVNRDARDVVLPWIREHNLEIRVHKQTRSVVFASSLVHSYTRCAIYRT